MTPDETIRLFAKTLENLEKWMEKAGEYAKSRGFEVDVLSTSRLAPDAFNFIQQVQSACDQAKYLAAYAAGQKPPTHPDTEQNFAELRERIRTVKTYLGTLQAKDFAGADERKVAPNWMGGRWLPGHEYRVELAVPNFFFHVTMAYAILRHNGVPLGKMDYVGGLPTREG